MNIFWKFLEPLLDEISEGGGGGSADPIGDAITSSLSEAGLTEAPPVEAAVEVKPEEAAEEAELAKLQAEIKAKNPTAKNKLDWDRHQAVLTRQRNKSEAERTKLAADHQKALDEWKQYEWAKDGEVQASLRAMQMAGTDRKGFIELLMKDPEYAQLIAFKEAQKQEQVQRPTEGRPGPDARTQDGQYEYYSDQGLQKLLDWQAQQVERSAQEKATKAALEAVEKQYGPIKSQYESQVMWQEALNRNRGVVENARSKWPGFRENEKAIKTFWNKPENHDLSLHDAYREVVVVQQFQSQAQKQQAREVELKKTWLAEMNAKPGAASSLKPGAVSDRKPAAGKREIEDVIMESIAGLKR